MTQQLYDAGRLQEATGDWARWDKSQWRQTNTNCDKCPFSKAFLHHRKLQRVTGHQMNHEKKREERRIPRKTLVFAPVCHSHLAANANLANNFIKGIDQVKKCPAYHHSTTKPSWFTYGKILAFLFHGKVTCQAVEIAAASRSHCLILCLKSAGNKLNQVFRRGSGWMILLSLSIFLKALCKSLVPS